MFDRWVGTIVIIPTDYSIPHISQVTLPPSQPERDALELQTRYTSVTHRTMEEVPWQSKSAPSALTKPVTRETRPDMVTLLLYHFLLQSRRREVK